MILLFLLVRFLNIRTFKYYILNNILLIYYVTCGRSVVVTILWCRFRDPGSIPGRGDEISAQ